MFIYLNCLKAWKFEHLTFFTFQSDISWLNALSTPEHFAHICNFCFHLLCHCWSDCFFMLCYLVFFILILIKCFSVELDSFSDVMYFIEIDFNFWFCFFFGTLIWLLIWIFFHCWNFPFVIVLFVVFKYAIFTFLFQLKCSIECFSFLKLLS